MNGCSTAPDNAGVALGRSLVGCSLVQWMIGCDLMQWSIGCNLEHWVIGCNLDQQVVGCNVDQCVIGRKQEMQWVHVAAPYGLWPFGYLEEVLWKLTKALKGQAEEAIRKAIWLHSMGQTLKRGVMVDDAERLFGSIAWAWRHLRTYSKADHNSVPPRLHRSVLSTQMLPVFTTHWPPFSHPAPNISLFRNLQLILNAWARVR
eukprot:1140731-Pelagomonas_calceolata.AAC.5